MTDDDTREPTHIAGYRVRIALRELERRGLADSPMAALLRACQGVANGEPLTEQDRADAMALCDELMGDDLDAYVD